MLCNDFFYSGNFLGGAILERSYGFIGQNTPEIQVIDDSDDEGGRGKFWGVSVLKHSNGLMEHRLITFANGTAQHDQQRQKH